MPRLAALVGLAVVVACVLAVNLHSDSVRAQALRLEVDPPCESGIVLACIYRFLN